MCAEVCAYVCECVCKHHVIYAVKMFLVTFLVCFTNSNSFLLIKSRNPKHLDRIRIRINLKPRLHVALNLGSNPN